MGVTGECLFRVPLLHCDDQLSLLGHDSMIDILPGICRVNVWNRGFEEGAAVAFIF